MTPIIILIMLMSITIGLVNLCLVGLNTLPPRHENPIRLATAFFSVLFVLELVVLLTII